MYLEQEKDRLFAKEWPPLGTAASQVAEHLRDIALCLEGGSNADRSILPFSIAGGVAARADDRVQGRPDYLAKVRSVVRARAVRVQVFGTTVIDDPAWSILLDLFEAYLTQRNRFVKSVGIASGAPSTTALRYLVLLDEVGLVERRADPIDRRRTLVHLSEIGQQKMLRYFNLLG